jgi:hypothetical protein
MIYVAVFILICYAFYEYFLNYVENYVNFSGGYIDAPLVETQDYDAYNQHINFPYYQQNLYPYYMQQLHYYNGIYSWQLFRYPHDAYY